MAEDEIRWNWYLIEADHGMLLTAKVEIVARGVDFLLPMTWRRALVDGHPKPISEPRLPGRYAFVCLSRSLKNEEVLSEQASAVKALRGVRDIFKNAAGHYSPVPKWEVQALKDIDAEEHREASKTRPKVTEPKFHAGYMVRILRHVTAEGHVGEYLFSVRGMATLAMGNGIKMSVPDCDISQITKGEAARLTA